jgi:hypothetical protein
MIKYLRLILKDRIILDGGGEGHITFLYFGSYKVDPLMLTKHLEGISPFYLCEPSFAKMGKNFDIDAIKYDILDSEDNCVIYSRRYLLMKECGHEVEEQNSKEYNPHVSKLTMDAVYKQNLVSLEVIGIESNDGSWKNMF